MHSCAVELPQKSKGSSNIHDSGSIISMDLERSECTSRDAHLETWLKNKTKQKNTLMILA